MKKAISIITLFLLATILSQAQDKDSKFSVAVSAGPSFPIGKFSNKTFDGIITESNAHPSGLAKNGWAIDFTAGYQLTKTIGLILQLGGSENKQDSASFERYLIQQYGSNIQTAAQTHDWKIVKTLAGGSFTLPVFKSNRLAFRSKVLAGLCKTSVPAYSYGYILDSVYLSTPVSSIFGSESHSKTKMAWAFCYQVAAGVTYKISQKFYLTGDINCFNSNPVYKYHYYPNFPLTTTPMVPGKDTYSLLSINAMLGVELKL